MDLIDDRVYRMMRDHGLSVKTGFLAEHPLAWLPSDPQDLRRTAEFVRMDELAYMLEYNVAHKEVAKVVALLPMPSRSFEGLPEQVLYRLALIYAMYTHAYFHETLNYANMTELMRDEKIKYLPPQLAVPLYELSQLIGMLPTMAYTLYSLWNWRLKDSTLPISLDNLAMIHSFTGSESEHWFMNDHQAVEVEMASGNFAFIKTCTLIENAMSAGGLEYVEPGEFASILRLGGDASYRALAIFRRMREHCDYRIYFDSVRLFYGFPRNVVYEGVKELLGIAQNYFGETGGQAGFQHLRLAANGMDHERFPYFPQMRLHLSGKVQLLIEWALRVGLHLRRYVVNGTREVRDASNYCVQAIVDWREFHLELAQEYIWDHGDRHGTGTTPFDWLQQLIDHARSFLIAA